MNDLFDGLKLFFNPSYLMGFFTFWGGGGSGGGGSQTSTSYSTNLPEYAKPYYQELLKQTGKNVFSTDSKGNVTGLKGSGDLPMQTVAGFSDLQRQAQQEVGGMDTPGQFGMAQQGLLGTGALAGGAAGMGLGQALSYNPYAQTFGAQQAAQYMSPYQQAVTDTALREARQQGILQRNQQALGSIGRGTFGGARQALLQAEGDRNLMRTLGDIQAQGSQQAFQNAQQQFNADQQRQQQAAQYAAGLGAQLFGTGLGGMQQAATGLGALGATEQQADLARLQAQSAAGAEQQALGQKQADIDYQNAMARQNWEKQQLQFYSDILRGNAGALGSTQVQYTPAPSQLSQIGGLGLAGLGLAKALG